MVAKLLKGCHILIVEDDFYQAQDIRDTLQQAGVEIVGCRATVPDLDEILERSKIDIALLDINLGDTQSFDFARALDAKGIPCVFLTGYDVTVVPNDLNYAKFISKPAEASAVITALHQVHSEAPKASGGGGQQVKS
ncbi:response regulator [Erythrobacter sp.]|uniref:response regulator n=1 Tax=Erythrobacter sp. TaxID=1042 RepID=UPI0025D1C736|nr:response regulator [Erythrobacter sp.]